jgi:hypothetical protein
MNTDSNFKTVRLLSGKSVASQRINKQQSQFELEIGRSPPFLQSTFFHLCLSVSICDFIVVPLRFLRQILSKTTTSSTAQTVGPIDWLGQAAAGHQDVAPVVGQTVNRLGGRAR